MSSASSASSSGSEQASSSSPPPHKRARVSDDSDSENSAQSDDSSNDSESESDAEEDDDTPVLSHAEKRRQKKKEELAAKKGKRVAEDANDAKGKAKVKNTAELPPSKVPKRQNSVWVGNLAFKTTPASLRNFFEGVGEITRIHMPMKMATGGPDDKRPRQENRGFAYVDFATPDAKTIAITRSENPLDGRRLLIKDGDDYKGRPAPSTAPGEDGAEAGAASKTAGLTKTAQKILRVQKQPPGPTLFLGNLGFETTEQSIRALLDSHRPKGGDDKEKWIRKVRMGTFEDSGKCKGWAFVDFTSTEHATAALTNPRNHTLDGRKLVVEYASPEAVRRGGGGAGPPRDRDRDRDRDRGDRDRTTKRDRAPRSAPTDDASGRPAKRARTGAGDGAEAGGTGDDGGRGGGAERRAANFKSGRKADAAGKGPRPRARPGAALALAKREDVSIQPSQGKKIVF